RRPGRSGGLPRGAPRRAGPRTWACAGAGWRVRRRTRAARGLPAPWRRTPSSSARERGQMTEDRRDVAVAEEQDGDGDERQREPRVEDPRARAERQPEREERADDRRPAERVVEERRPREEPRILL